MHDISLHYYVVGWSKELFKQTKYAECLSQLWNTLSGSLVSLWAGSQSGA